MLYAPAQVVPPGIASTYNATAFIIGWKENVQASSCALHAVFVHDGGEA